MSALKTVVDRTAEKVVLAKQLGLHGWAEIHEVIDMKFKPITRGEIGKMLREDKRVYGWKYFDGDDLAISLFATVIPSIVVGVVFSAFLSNHLEDSTKLFTKSFNVGLMVWLTITALNLAVRCRSREIEVKRMNLEEWSGNLPYGALLACKEAKEKGLHSFQIHYPSLRNEVLKSDPVIVGFKNRSNSSTPMYEIFSWDDGKVYE